MATDSSTFIPLDGRIVEPDAKNGFIISLLGGVGLVSGLMLGIPILPGASLVAILIGGILGVKGVRKIKKEKSKYKGKGFGLAAIWIMISTILLTIAAGGIIIYLASTGALS